MATSPWEVTAGASILTTVVGIVTLVIKAGPDWLRARAQRDNLTVDTSAKVQGMTLEYAEQVRDQLKEALVMVHELKAALELANAENDHYRSQIPTLPQQYRDRFKILPAS